MNVIFFAIFFAKTKICNTFALAKRNIGLWCNGNTTDSGPVILGSNPGSPTRKRRLKRVVFFRVVYQGSFSLWRLGRLVYVWLLSACADNCACKMIASKNKFSPHHSPTPTIFDCNSPTSVTSRLLPPFESLSRENGRLWARVFIEALGVISGS